MHIQRIILIVDDDPSGRDTLEALLSTQGYKLIFAADGQAALRQAQRLKPDLILLDIMMRGLNGYQVCQAIRADDQLAHVPVIMVTALDDRESRLRGIESGADDFITKPIDREELRARVRKTLQLDRYRQLLRERAKFEWVVEHSDDGFVTLNPTNHIQYANSQARRYLHLPEHNLPGDTFGVLIHQHYHPQPESAWRDWPHTLLSDTPRYLVRPETPNTNPLWLQVDVMEMVHGPNERLLLRLRDVTHLMHTHRLMWSFHGQVSHKLRTPLGHLTTTLSYLQDEHNNMDDEERDNMLRIAGSGAARLDNEIQNIFKYMELPTILAKQHPHTSLETIVHTFEDELFHHHIDKANVEVLDFADRLAQIYVTLPPHSMQLIIAELLLNAKKFHPDQNPRVTIKLTSRSLTVHEQTQAGVCISIRDDGTTLLPEQLARIWTPYYQAEKYFSGQMKGMGLGLSMVASLVWDAGGQCTAYHIGDQPGLVIDMLVPIVEVAPEK